MMCAASVAQAGDYINLSFSADGALAAYGLTPNSLSGAVADGVLLLTRSGGGQGSADIGAFAGDLSISFDVRTVANYEGAFNVGFRVGDNNFIFHPGYPGGAFRIDGPGGHFNAGMGFTPTPTAMHKVRIDIVATTGSTSIQILDGGNSAWSYQETFADTNYMSGTTMLGFSAGGAGTGEWDNLVISSPSAPPVPEPASYALLVFGLATLGTLAKSRRARVN